MATKWKRSSSFDFSDGKIPPLTQHPDMDNPFADNVNQPSHLERNKSERRRLQGLQRSNPMTTMTPTPYKPQGWHDKWRVWMINEGGKRLFFSFFVLLHLLVMAFGFSYYDLKDSFVGARKTFGITYREFFRCEIASVVSEVAFVSYCPYGCACSSRRRCIHSPSCLPQLHLIAPSHTAESLHSVR